MTAAAAFPPYLTLPDSAIALDPIDGWELIREDQEPEVIPDRSALPSWDSSLRFGLRRRFQLKVSPDEALGLEGREAKFKLVTRLNTARGLGSRIVDERSAIFGDEGFIEILVHPDSRTLAYDIRLTTWLVLESVSGQARVDVAPKVSGSRLWHDSWRAKIEGGRTRLPFELTSFSKSFPGWRMPGALFHVDVADYPDLQFEQAVCVYLNTDYPEFVTAIEKSKPAETAILWDGVVRRIVSVGLGDEFTRSSEWQDDSLGAQVRTWTTAIFPGYSIKSIAELRLEHPSRFEAMIQSWAGIASKLAYELPK
ncbi:hypothetical protein [Dokdonella sp.]|uniref:hypothetical protein n=1 Tax=Dokdonella sp. TaxID=2291710 RepID=UPI0035271C6B